MSEKMLVFAGTYTGKPADMDRKSDGIYVYWLDLDSGALSPAAELGGIDHPSYLALHPQQPYLYATNELVERRGQEEGAVSAFRFDPATGKLAFLDQQPSHGRWPCHVWVDGSGKWVLAANYGSGSAAIYPVLEDGRLGEASDVIQHSGSGVNPDRQEGPHAHCIITDPTNQYVFLADLGIDRLMVYRLNHQTGKLTLASWAHVDEGAGPRHIEFHSSGRYCFLINEMASTINVFRWEDGALHNLQTISTLPEDTTGESTTAAIHVAPSGRFVYGSNRGHDSIAIFRFDETSGQLTPVGHESTQGKTPRDFMIDPTGAFLLAANQNSHTIVSFRIDADTGKLTPTGHVTEVMMPVCLKPLKV
jgi:6-phosphogluconolactonase